MDIKTATTIGIIDISSRESIKGAIESVLEMMHPGDLGAQEEALHAACEEATAIIDDMRIKRARSGPSAYESTPRQPSEAKPGDLVLLNQASRALLFSRKTVSPEGEVIFNLLDANGSAVSARLEEIQCVLPQLAPYAVDFRRECEQVVSRMERDVEFAKGARVHAERDYSDSCSRLGAAESAMDQSLMLNPADPDTTIHRKRAADTLRAAQSNMSHRSRVLSDTNRDLAAKRRTLSRRLDAFQRLDTGFGI